MTGRVGRHAVAPAHSIDGFHTSHTLPTRSGPGFDRASDMGREYEGRKAESVFYRDATFHSAGEVAGLLESGGFSIEA